MTKTLQTRNVFIDTECFVQSGLHFDTAALKAFRKLCQDEELEHISTTVIEREVKAKLKEAVKEGLDAIRTFQRKAKLLSSYNDEALKPYFCALPEEETYQKAFDVFEDFLSDCKTEFADILRVSTEDLIDMYFATEPPFGENKKKAEFPDAINMLALQNFISDKIYVVSKDSDLESFCNGNDDFIYMDALSDLLDIYNSHNKVLTDSIKANILANESVIQEKVSDSIKECDVWNASDWEDSMVEAISVIKTGVIEPKIVFMNDEYCQITFDIEIDYQVEVSGPDYINGTYDKEDGILYTFGDTTRVQNFNEYFSVEVELAYEFDGGKLTGIDIAELEIPSIRNGFEVFVEEQANDWD